MAKEKADEKTNDQVEQTETKVVETDVSANETANTGKGDLSSNTLVKVSEEAKMMADEKFQQLLNSEVAKKLAEDEVARRMIEHRQKVSVINTNNPYGIKDGEKITYIVNGVEVDCNGIAVAK